MKKKLIELEKELIKKIELSSCLDDLNQIKSEFLGKNNQINTIIKELAHLDNTQKKDIGILVNQVKERIKNQIQDKCNTLQNLEKSKQLNVEGIDFTLATANAKNKGTLHPLSQTIQSIYEIFRSIGFEYVECPELEKEYYNFDALNITIDHPARDQQDSFYISESDLLRSQTSTVQIRTLEKLKPPVSIISMGRCFRRDNLDATHSHTFHQLEGFIVDQSTSFSKLKGILSLFAKKMFGSKTEMSFRPDFFPFTEPSAEYAISCFICNKKGCGFCKNSGWLEIGGCGLIHPKVLSTVNLNPEQYQGYAFGLGIERIAMLQHKISDIRFFYENKLEFLKQF